MDILVKKREIFEISLDSNPSTGYKWKVENVPEMLHLVEEKYELNLNQTGGSGKVIFVFKGLNKGNCELIFIYKRPWEEQEIKKIVKRVAIVENNGNDIRIF